MAKETSSYRLSEETKTLLKLISEHHHRTSTNMLEVLILQEAERLKIKLPKG